MPAPFNIFYSYADEDNNLRRELDTHLSLLRRQGRIKTWDRNQIPAGLDPEDVIASQLDRADIILLLVSPNFLASERCYDFEMPRALERHNAGKAQVIPIILRPTDWKGAPFAHLQILPTDGKPIRSWLNEDEAFEDVVNGIRQSIREFEQGQTTTQSSPAQPVSANQNSQTSQSNSSVPASVPSQSGIVSQLTQANATAQTSSFFPVISVSPAPQVSQVISKAGAPDAMKAATDKAVRRLSADQLRFRIWINALRKFIISPDTTTPLTISIDGTWGTGKSSFMYMLQDELEPSSFRDKWQKVRWPWLKWFGLFIATLPIWTAGKLMVYVGNHKWNVWRVWFEDINVALSYDPEIDKDIDPKTLPRHQPFWAKIAAWHCPKEPTNSPTIWFNAWKFDQEEQLWAALALAVLDQIKKKYNPLWRFIFWVALEFKRLSWPTALYYTFLKIALPIALGLLAWKFDVFIKLATGTYRQGSLGAFENVLPLSQFLLLIGAGLTGIIQISSIIKDPFQIPIKRVFDKPDYREKIGFIGSFEKDFSLIVSLITHRTLGWKTRKLIIFIDDLDRCKLPKAVDIVEGINLFLDSEQCVFVIGMDTTAVVASIETKYQDLFKQMREERTGIVSAGRLFLDKIIQVPLHVPPSIETSMNNLVEAITKREERPLQSQQRFMLSSSQGNTPTPTAHTRGSSLVKPTTQSLRTGSLSAGSASYTPEEVSQATNLGVSLLPENPRQVKRFINLFRLYIYIANEEHLFEEENQIGLTMDRLAIWVVWSLRWSELIRHLSEEALLVASEADLIIHMEKITNSLDKEGSWMKAQPSLNGQDDVPPMQNRLTFIKDMRTVPENGPSHWCHLPWELWFRNRDFLKCAKELKAFWLQPQPDKINWLHTMLLMTRVTTPTTAVPASNGNAQSTNQQNNVVSQAVP